MDGRIHSVELLEMALDALRMLGYRSREDALGGFPGGACQIKGQKWLFLDPSVSTRERLQLAIDALAADHAAATLDLSGPLAKALKYARGGVGDDGREPICSRPGA